MNASSLTAQSY